MKKTTNQPRRRTLAIRSETIAELTLPQLRDVVGGSAPTVGGNSIIRCNDCPTIKQTITNE